MYPQTQCLYQTYHSELLPYLAGSTVTCCYCPRAVQPYPGTQWMRSSAALRPDPVQKCMGSLARIINTVEFVSLYSKDTKIIHKQCHACFVLC